MTGARCSALDYVAAPVSPATRALCEQANAWHADAPSVGEGRRIVAYCVRELLSGTRSQSDVTMFCERVRQVIGR